jgi:ABC-type multidrug transport system ATPase subunit
MIQIQDLCKSYGSNPVLRGVSFSVEPGELVLLLGGNGAGKSTLLRCLLGLMPYQGAIRVAGLDPLRQGREVRRNVGYMPQGIALHLDLTVAETLRFYAGLRRAPIARAHELLESVELGDQLETAVGALSGGMRQRLQFALALLDDPPVLLLDEPSASLDDASRDLMVRRLDQLAHGGKAVLVSTHGYRELAGVADRAILLVAGIARLLGPGTGLDQIGGDSPRWADLGRDSSPERTASA